MPNRWIHETIDIISFGRSYWELHKEKDAPYKYLGKNHRGFYHEWYQSYGIEWDFNEPFPPKLKAFFTAVLDSKGPDNAEETQAWCSHDYWDKIWDDSSYDKRKYIAVFFKWLLLNPQILKDWAGVDVLLGKVKVVYGKNYGYEKTTDVWETEPTLKRDYEHLRNFVELKTLDELL